MNQPMFMMCGMIFIGVKMTYDKMFDVSFDEIFKKHKKLGMNSSDRESSISECEKFNKLIIQLKDSISEISDDYSTQAVIFSELDIIEKYYKDLRLVKKYENNLLRFLDSRDEHLTVSGQMKYGDILYDLLDIICQIFKLDIFKLATNISENIQLDKPHRTNFNLNYITEFDDSVYQIVYSVSVDDKRDFMDFILVVEYKGPAKVKDISDAVLDCFQLRILIKLYI